MIFERYSENKKTIIAISILLLILGGILIFQKMRVAEKNWDQISSELRECLPKSDSASLQKCLYLMSTMKSFEDCIAAGFNAEDPNGSMCSLPDGRVFLKDIQVSGTSTPLQVFSQQDPFDKPGVIDIGWQWIVAEHVPGGLIIRGTWDKNEDGVFVEIYGVNNFRRIKNLEGAPTPYFTTGKDIYIFKTDTNSKKATTNTPIPTPFLIGGADINTFVPGISHDLSYISKDKNHVYIHGLPDLSLDAQTLIPLEGMNYFFQYYFKDKNHVYDARTEQGSGLKYRVTQYDPGTFEIFTGLYGYTKDRNGVYFEDKKISGADPATFQVLTAPKLSAGKADHATYSYSKDNKNVYYFGQIIPNADPKTFAPIGMNGLYTHYYGKDAIAVYEGTTTVPFADPKTFKPLWYPIYEGCGPSKYSVDATHVFFERTIVPGADPATFKPLIYQYGRDKNGLWFKDKLETEMPADFEPMCNYG